MKDIKKGERQGDSDESGVTAEDVGRIQGATV